MQSILLNMDIWVLSGILVYNMVGNPLRDRIIMDIMDQTIILDCQTKSNSPCCESCIYTHSVRQKESC